MIILALASDQGGSHVSILCNSHLKILLTWPKSSADFHSALFQTTILHPTTDGGDPAISRCSRVS